jgi:hypothetical protein
VLVDRLLALLAFAALAAFLWIVVAKVARVDLTVVVLLCMVLVIYDLWTQLFPRR